MSLRSGLLSGRRIALAGVSPEIAEVLSGLGAEPEPMAGVPAEDNAAATAWVSEHSPLHALAYDARPAFAPGGHTGLRTALDEAWVCARSLATGAFIPGDAGGRLLFLAPSVGSGALAEAVRAGLESLARTLSVEWARHAVTAVVICPNETTTDAQLAELIGYLVSPAGAYFTGCRFDLGLAGARS
jgi:NAD(P)-dependent dehydrogenase (short-subunit alcohol dehydrogenase family)